MRARWIMITLLAGLLSAGSVTAQRMPTQKCGLSGAESAFQLGGIAIPSPEDDRSSPGV